MDVSSLFREHNAGLLRFLERRGVDRQEASDIAQDAFVRLMTTTQPIGNIRAYLYAITRNLAVNAVRRRRLAPFQHLAHDLLWEIADDAPSPEEIVLWRQELAILQTVFASLTARQQQIFYLSRIEGCTLAEIGRRLGMSPNTAYAQLTRILVQMRVRLRMSELAQADATR